MVPVEFIYKDKTYLLGEENCSAVFNDEEKPIDNFDLLAIIEALHQQNEIEFDTAYYESACENCNNGIAEKLKHFKFLEFHFYAFTKSGQYIMSNLSKEFENTSQNQLIKSGKIDASYIVSIIVCVACGEYTIEIEFCD